MPILKIGTSIYYFDQFFSKTVWKWKQLDLRGILSVPLDPPMHTSVISYLKLHACDGRALSLNVGCCRGLGLLTGVEHPLGFSRVNSVWTSQNPRYFPPKWKQKNTGSNRDFHIFHKSDSSDISANVECRYLPLCKYYIMIKCLHFLKLDSCNLYAYWFNICGNLNYLGGVHLCMLQNIFSHRPPL